MDRLLELQVGEDPRSGQVLVLRLELNAELGQASSRVPTRRTSVPSWSRKSGGSSGMKRRPRKLFWSGLGSVVRRAGSSPAAESVRGLRTATT
jgi:hypothetical protein